MRSGMIRALTAILFITAAMGTTVSLAAPSSSSKSKAPDSTGSNNFSFIHLSDPHVEPYYDMPSESQLQDARSYSCVRTIKGIGEIPLAPYNIVAPKPSFIINTGDIAEFGHPGVTWDVTNKYFDDLGFQIYYAPGNHDNTWVASTEHFRKLYGGQNYSFDHGGIHFVCLNSSTLQDPNPSFGEEVLEFLRQDLQKVGKKRPVIPFFHHPLDSSEFCSRFDVDQLLEILRPYNVPLMLDGHGHSAVTHNFWGYDAVMGGSTFSKAGANTSGYQMVDIRDNVISIAYKLCDDTSASKAMLTKHIATKSNYPTITVSSPQPRSTVRDKVLKIAAQIAIPDNADEDQSVIEPGKKVMRARPVEDDISGWYDLDDETTGILSVQNNRITGKVDLGELRNGAHFLRINIARPGQDPWFKTVRFFVEQPANEGSTTAAWRYQMKGSSKSTPLVHKGMVYAGANDGYLYALNARSGKLAWKFKAGAEILASPAVWKNTILVGAGNGKFFGVSTSGKRKWQFQADDAAYSSPVVDDTGSVYFGTNDGYFYALRASDGKLLWKNQEARYGIESRPWVEGDHVLFGAWDGFVYSLNKKTGEVAWKSPGPNNQSTKGNLRRYLAPADNGPCATEVNVFIADRGYKAGKYTAAGDFVTTISGDCTALTLSETKDALYLRGMKGPVSKVDLDGNELWKSGVQAGRVPVSPTEADGKLFVATNSGILHALDASTGKTLWTYALTPRQYVMSGNTVSRGMIYTTGMDGYITAVRIGD